MTLTLQNFGARNAKGFELQCTRGDDFFPKAKSLLQTQDVQFCCYVPGNDGRYTFSSAEAYWNVSPATRTIFYWQGKTPESPERMLRELAEGQLKLQLDLLRLQAVSMSVKDQLARWHMKSDVPIETVEETFKSVQVSLDERTIKGILNAEKSLPKEAGVQAMWGDLWRYFVPAGKCVKDCRSPRGIEFDGRRHDIDFVYLAREIRSITYLDTSIEVKEKIETDAQRREVVLQLLDRFSYTFQGQPDRAVCWGLGLDASCALFVRCGRNMEYEVTPSCKLFTGQDNAMALLIAKFLHSSSASRGYINVTMPMLWNMQAEALLATGRNATVYVMDADTVAKVGTREAIHSELAVLKKIAEKAPDLVCPALIECPVETNNTELPNGFKMRRLAVAEVKTEDDIVVFASHIFWRLAVLHAVGYAHNDVKPANVLSEPDVDRKFFLCDFGSATLKNAVPRDGFGGATDAYAHLEDGFEDPGESRESSDLESLFWSVLTLFVQVKKEREFTNLLSNRLECFFSLSASGGVVSENKVEVVANLALREYLVAQAKSTKLKVPFSLMEKYLRMRPDFGSDDAWIEAVAENEQAENQLACPPLILRWFLEREKKK